MRVDAKINVMQSLAKQVLLLAVLCAALTTGCSNRPEMVQVRGRVTYKDGTIPSGGLCVIRFQPSKDSPAEIRKAASADIQSDGFFEAFTRNPGDGVFLGKYDVSFSVLRDQSDSSSSLIDPKYTKSSTTPYHVTIEDDVSDLEFILEPAQGG